MNSDIHSFQHDSIPGHHEISAADSGDDGQAREADEALDYDAWFSEQVALGRLSAARGELLPDPAFDH